MAYEIIFAPEAIEDLKRLTAGHRASAVAGIETHLRHAPRKESKTRIKRLRGLRQPEYRLRIDQLRVYHDVTESEVHILAIIAKNRSQQWLEKHGIAQ